MSNLIPIKAYWEMSKCWPDVWGDGVLFAFSGIDGSTDFNSGFTGIYGELSGGITWYTPLIRRLCWKEGKAHTVRLALGDAYDLFTQNGRRAAVFSSWHTIIGLCVANDKPWLEDEADTVETSGQGEYVSCDNENHNAVCLLVTENRFSLSFGLDGPEAMRRAKQGLALDFENILASRLAPYTRLPRLADSNLDKLLGKCLSVMRVNTYSPAGLFRTRWSTPDRLPHRRLWLWDSAFHAVAMSHFDAEVAWDDVTAVFTHQRDDGFVPLCSSPTGPGAELTQPPLLAWAVWHVFQAKGGMERFNEILPKLSRYLEWDLANRDQNKDGLLEWTIRDNADCRGGESGLDNSPVFDDGEVKNSVGFSTLWCHDAKLLADLYRAAGDAESSKWWRIKAERMQKSIHEQLWDPSQGGYRDRRMDGSFSDVDSIEGLFPLLLGGVDERRLALLCDRIRDPKGYGTAVPFPSVARDDSRWCHDMWRGPTWLNTAYLVLIGLRRHQQHTLADEMITRLVDHVLKQYHAGGVLYEYYDAEGVLSPPQLSRKGWQGMSYDPRQTKSCIRDYHWTAAVVFLLLQKKDTLFLQTD
jgi:hypothetical protein